MKDIPLKQFTTKVHFKKMTAEDLRKSPSFNLVDENGEFVAIVVVPVSPFRKNQIQNLAEAGNALVEE